MAPTYIGVKLGAADVALSGVGQGGPTDAVGHIGADYGVQRCGVALKQAFPRVIGGIDRCHL